MLNLFVGVITTAMDDAAGKQKERNDMEEKLETYLEEHAIDKATASRCVSYQSCAVSTLRYYTFTTTTLLLYCCSY